MAQRTKTEAPAHTRRLVKNQSDRNGANPVWIVVHSTESTDIPDSVRDVNAIVNWFNNPASQASSHIVIDGDGNTVQMVLSNRKAWTQGAANPYSLSIEFIARAAQGGVSWEDAQIRAGARWAAYWALRYNIPARKGKVKNVGGNAIPVGAGVMRHKDFTNVGIGSHVDPGDGFPMTKFLRYMKYYMANGWTIVD